MTRTTWTPLGVLSTTAREESAGELWSDLVSGTERQDLPVELAFLAWQLGRLANEKGRQHELEDTDGRALALLALAVLAVEREGSTRLPLDEDVLEVRLRELGADTDDVERVRDLARRGSPLIDSVEDDPGELPLVVVADAVASQRTRALELRTAERLASRLTAPTPTGRGDLEPILEEIARRPLHRDGVTLALSEEQREALVAALTGRLAIVTGGPGTGKTSLVTSLLRVVARLPEPSLDRVVLAAPTGKAADRLGTSIRRAVAELPDPGPEDVRLAEAEIPSRTVHRLLGASADARRFLHHERNPIPADLVVVDEASMLDLALTDRLLRALLPTARLVLVGDAEQLPSIDPGAVLRDLVEVTERVVPERLGRLRHSFRADVSEPSGRAILAASAAIQEGQRISPLPARQTTAEITSEGVELLEIGDREALLPFLEWWEAERIDDLPGRATLVGTPLSRRGAEPGEAEALDGEDEERLRRLLVHAARSRIITPLRGIAGGRGAEAINRWFHSRRTRWTTGARDDSFRPGEPVLVTRNDYRRELFNGDQGLVMPVEESGTVRSVVAFPRGAGFRLFPLAALRGLLELAWATSVHRAQGSEFDHVALVLPDRDVRVLSRPLVYTAVSRARRSVLVVGSRERLESAVARTSVRHSGLPDEIVARLDGRRGER